MTEKARDVGIIGLGAMGMGVAKSLLRHGFAVHTFDVRAEAMREIALEGAIAHQSPLDLAPHVDTLIVLVVNAQQTDEVLFGTKGAVGGLKNNVVVLSSATVSPEFAADLAIRLAAQGLRMIDAPVSGGPIKAAAGQMSVMASGTDDAFQACELVLNAISAKVYRLGSHCGQGSTAKMINQLLAGVHIAAAAEAMALGIRAGADPARIYEVICNSAGGSWMFANRMPHVLAGDYTPLSAVNIFVKDLGIVLDYGKKSIFPLPLAATAHQMFMQASAAGHGAEDDTAVIKIFPGIELPALVKKSGE